MRIRTWLPIVLSLPLVAQSSAPRDLQSLFQENRVHYHGTNGSALEETGKAIVPDNKP